MEPGTHRPIHQNGDFAAEQIIHDKADGRPRVGARNPETDNSSRIERIRNILLQGHTHRALRIRRWFNGDRFIEDEPNQHG